MSAAGSVSSHRESVVIVGMGVRLGNRLAVQMPRLVPESFTLALRPLSRFVGLSVLACFLRTSLATFVFLFEYINNAGDLG